MLSGVRTEIDLYFLTPPIDLELSPMLFAPSVNPDHRASGRGVLSFLLGRLHSTHQFHRRPLDSPEVISLIRYSLEGLAVGFRKKLFDAAEAAPLTFKGQLTQKLCRARASPTSLASFLNQTCQFTQYFGSR